MQFIHAQVPGFQKWTICDVPWPNPLDVSASWEQPISGLLPGVTNATDESSVSHVIRLVLVRRSVSGIGLQSDQRQSTASSTSGRWISNGTSRPAISPETVKGFSCCPRRRRRWEFIPRDESSSCLHSLHVSVYWLKLDLKGFIILC